MINILGTRRIIILAGLVAINALLGAALYFILLPHQMDREREFKGVQARVSSLQSDITRMQIEFDQLEVQRARFEELKAKGLFSNQGRRQAELLLEKIQKEARVISAVASVLSGTVEDNEEAAKAEYKILTSPIKVRIEAIDDIDVFRYVYLMKNKFPGHISVERIDLQRKENISAPLLRSIATGSNTALVQADIDLTWRTMIPQSEVIEPEARKP